MAKGGGGSWKVAYADFVTAMMAFFMVMWLTSQDQKVKQAVARYFVTPMGVVETGSSKSPNHTGAIFAAPDGGSLPNSQTVVLGRGRVSHTAPFDVGSTATKLVSDWLKTSEADAFWQTETRQVRDYSRMSKELLDKSESAEESARRRLSNKLRDQISRTVQSGNNELSHELLAQILSEVNWNELAEDLLADQEASEGKK